VEIMTDVIVGTPGIVGCVDHRNAARCQRDHESGRCICRADVQAEEPVAYVENLSAQEAAYWEARRQGMNLTDKQIGDLLRAAAGVQAEEQTT
jgi:hypothetical protein